MKRIHIKVLVTIVFATVAAAGAGSIVTSKDSLWIYNNSRSGRWTDSVTIRNTGPQGVHLDSIRLQITDWYVQGSRTSVAEAEARMDELHDGVRKMRYASIDSAGATGYRFNFSPGVPSGDSLFAMGPAGDSVILTNLQMGYCFSCGLEQYPRYLKGTLQLYYTNGQVVSIRIFSDDLRPTGKKHVLQIRQHTPSGREHSPYLLNGQQVPNKALSYLSRYHGHRLIFR